MTQPPFALDDAIRRSAESDQTLSYREIREKFAQRWFLLLICVVVLPVVAALLTSLVPLNFTSSAQILIRHESGSLGIFEAPGRNATDASGPASAELLRSVPVVSRMVEAVQAEDADVARAAYKVIAKRAYLLIAPLLPKEKEEGGVPDPELTRSLLAKEFKPTIKVTSLQTEMRSMGREDELLEVSVSSTNPLKVAAMTTALCESFIKEHNLRSEREAIHAIEIITSAETQTRERINTLANLPLDGPNAAAEFLEAASRSQHPQPLTESLARHLADLELSLVEARRTYGANSPELKKAQQTLEQTRTVYARQEALDGLNNVLSSLKEKQRAAQLNLELARRNQTGLSIVEPALPPKVTSLVKVMHYAMPVGVGLFLGIVLGSGLIITSNALDGRVRSRWEIERVTGVPILGTLGSADAKNPAVLPPVLEKILGALDASSSGDCRVIAVVSPHGAEDVSHLSRRLAEALAADARSRVILVDGDLSGRALTKASGRENKAGLAELLRDPELSPESLLEKEKESSLLFLAAGKAPGQPTRVRHPWTLLISSLKRNADFIVVDAGGLELGRTPRVLLQAAQVYLLGAVSGITTQASLESAVRELAPIGDRALGTVLIVPRGSAKA